MSRSESRVIHHGWRALVAGCTNGNNGHGNQEEITDALARYAEAWQAYRSLAKDPLCPTLYEGRYFGLPGTMPEPGLDDSVEHCEPKLRVA